MPMVAARPMFMTSVHRGGGDNVRWLTALKVAMAAKPSSNIRRPRRTINRSSATRTSGDGLSSKAFVG